MVVVGKDSWRNLGFERIGGAQGLARERDDAGLGRCVRKASARCKETVECWLQKTPRGCSSYQLHIALGERVNTVIASPPPTMSTESAATAASGDGGAASARRAGLEGAGVRSTRGEKKAGRGRRRRAAGEQRRNEHQRWGQFMDEDEGDFRLVAPSLPNARSRVRRNSGRYELEEDVVDADVALALSISIAERNSVSQVEGLPASVIAGLTYESLAQLEDVRCVASSAVVAALPVCSFLKEEAVSDVCEEQVAGLGVCVICLGEYDHGDSQVRLPCLHTFHQVCGAEWLLKYSKLCPVCKHDVTEVATEGTS